MPNAVHKVAYALYKMSNAVYKVAYAVHRMLYTSISLLLIQ